jgi:hypothetical protein
MIRSDLELHESFTTFQRFLYIIRFVWKVTKEDHENGLENVISTFERKSIMKPCLHLLPQVLNGYNYDVYTEFGASFHVISDLSHPLIKKYDFDPAEFMVYSIYIY